MDEARNEKHQPLLAPIGFWRYLSLKTRKILRERAFYVAFPVLGIFLMNNPAIDINLVKDRVGSFVLAQVENPQSPAPAGGSLTPLITQENSLLPSSQILSQEEVITRRINVVVTAYSSETWQTDDSPFITASGTYVRDGVIASNLLTFGSKVKIPEIFGQKIFAVEDRLHSRKGFYHIDIWFPSFQEAAAFGAKYTYIEVIE